MRFAHLDEAGISARERYAVVAGIISNPDTQWRALEQYLSDMADALVPKDLRSGIVFHAKDIWHGTKAFPKDRFSLERRNEILLELAKIPKKFDIPVVVGAINKEDQKKTGAGNHNALCYAMAFSIAVIGVEYFMLQWGKDELAQLIVEDTAEMRRHAKWGYDRLRDPSAWTKPGAGFLPVTRIVENPLFSPKTDSSILQVADTLAFVTCRRIRGRTDVQFLFDEFAENVITFPAWSDARPPGGRTGLQPLPEASGFDADHKRRGGD
jgi:hypothetical protein